MLRKAGMEVETTEVESVPQLEKVLDEISPDTLLWFPTPITSMPARAKPFG
ncbi:MAG: hypothetical protein H6573_15490 [Lewinellaceae bacterium]|nr:hypothetical protein [Lewinellaceae bacterium]